jgi:hypothetical protein
MPRLSRTVVAARETFAIEAFRQGKSIDEVQLGLAQGWGGHKMNLPRLNELKRSVTQPDQAVATTAAPTAASESVIEGSLDANVDAPIVTSVISDDVNDVIVDVDMNFAADVAPTDAIVLAETTAQPIMTEFV